MSKFTLHTPDSAPADSKERLQEAKESMGMIPNLYAVMAELPELLEGYQKLDELVRDSGFDNDELTVLWQTISTYNDCHYCKPAHAAIAQQMDVDDAISKAIREEKSLDDDKLEALRKFILEMLEQRGKPSDDSLAAFRDAGYENKHILAVVLGIAQKTMSNYTNHLAKTPVDDAFKKFE
ncbi:carboxymuconolactone decarboxylase family protein [Pseudidiomarina insulisalsae]|uniref:Carboxymuconolactone decarboxylase n=1 Tax=Pseudidiomarina insulisalsae TaxID=575789 RepID=A0A432YDF1_9GAMM|nr:carboxymuconolactone decarboxylase family protein [Pseudidiomarina insulisalsae]RUO58994.1 carboxymuconolactone decarboxylase [Pseudidiomarina insulisalsae]